MKGTSDMKRLLCLLALAQSMSGFATAAPTARQIRLVERATTDKTTHLGPKSDNLGDVLTFSKEIFDASNKQHAGTDQGYCLRVAVGKAFECNWTLKLPDGQITVEGPFYDASDSVLAITGGTGAYAGAGGEMHLHARDAAGSSYDFAYFLRK
jgi:hypothetical protein